MNIKKIILPFITSIFLLTSCETLNQITTRFFSEDTDNSSSVFENFKLPELSKDKIDTSIWDLSVVDTARDVNYLTDIEKDVILESNMARSNPQKYAELYIKPRIKEFSGKTYANYLLTNEGVTVVNECVNYMSRQKPFPVLTPSKGLSHAAKDHASTQCLTNQTGHKGTDGSTPFTRMKRYGSYTTTAGENIAYGSTSAREIVVKLLIDDGVKSRGHRKNILEKSFTNTGVGYANKHKTFGSECVITYSDTFIEKE